MRKANNQAPAISSFKDAGYQSARFSEGLGSVAQWVLEKNPDFLNSPRDEEKAELKEGWAVRWQELNPAKGYSADWIPVESGETFQATLAYCLSYSQQAFGQLKNENPVQHGVIKQVRDAFSKYVSNRMTDLCTAIRRAKKTDAPSTRTQAKMFSDYLSDTFDSIKARCKTAKARNDETAPDEVKLRMAIDAFYKQIK